MRHWQPLCERVEHGVEDFMQIHRARLGAFAYAFQQGPNLLELFQSDVASGYDFLCAILLDYCHK